MKEEELERNQTCGITLKGGIWKQNMQKLNTTSDMSAVEVSTRFV